MIDGLLLVVMVFIDESPLVTCELSLTYINRRSDHCLNSDRVTLPLIFDLVSWVERAHQYARLSMFYLLRQMSAFVDFRYLAILLACGICS